MDRLLTVTDPVTGGDIVRADVVVASSESTITDAPAEATHTSIAEVANLNILSGQITADAVRAEATAIAGGSASARTKTGTRPRARTCNSSSGQRFWLSLTFYGLQVSPGPRAAICPSRRTRTHRRRTA